MICLTMKTLSSASLAVLLIILIFKKTNAQQKRIIVLTGDKGHGKSTTVRKIFNRLKEENVSVVGYYSRKYIKKFQGTGLEAVNLETGERNPYVMYTYYYTANRKAAQVGQYIIDTGGFERIVKPILSNMGDVVKIALFDEMGKYECVSKYFFDEMKRLFKSTTSIILGTSTSPRMFLSLFGNITKESDIFFSPIKRENRTEMDRLISGKLISLYKELKNE